VRVDAPETVTEGFTRIVIVVESTALTESWTCTWITYVSTAVEADTEMIPVTESIVIPLRVPPPTRVIENVNGAVPPVLLKASAESALPKVVTTLEPFVMRSGGLMITSTETVSTAPTWSVTVMMTVTVSLVAVSKTLRSPAWVIAIPD